ncbi:MAG: hypothetical protein AAGJ08_20170 [Cyanobacteria bacterium P01_H01_bin.35]
MVYSYENRCKNGAIHFSPLLPCLPCPPSLATTKKSRPDTDLATDVQMDISVISCQLLVNNTEVRARHRCNIEGVSVHY